MHTLNEAMILAIKEYNVRGVRKLLLAGASANAVDHTGWPALLLAAGVKSPLSDEQKRLGSPFGNPPIPRQPLHPNVVEAMETIMDFLIVSGADLQLLLGDMPVRLGDPAAFPFARFTCHRGEQLKKARVSLNRSRRIKIAPLSRTFGLPA